MDMEIQHDVPLKPLNTFGVEARADYFAEVNEIAGLEDFFKTGRLSFGKEENVLILGGGSNILFTGDFHGLVVKINLKEVSMKEESGKVLVTAGAGEVWDKLVEQCVQEGLYGLENLSGIPGSVGAAPIQNIGAYGAEMRDCFHSLDAMDRTSGEVVRFGKDQCRFGYRDSIFKNESKGRYIILSVTFSLSRKAAFNLNYRALKDKLATRGEALTLSQVREAVLEIRSAKLPDPAVTGNAGSFFKNPVVDHAKLASLLRDFPGMVHYTAAEGGNKLAAGWLIEQCGLKGHRDGQAGVHKDQALVLINLGQASGSEILKLSEKVRESVMQKFGVSLEAEVWIV